MQNKNNAAALLLFCIQQPPVIHSHSDYLMAIRFDGRSKQVLQTIAASVCVLFVSNFISRNKY